MLNNTQYPYSICGSWFVVKSANNTINIDNLHGWRGCCTVFSTDADHDIYHDATTMIYRKSGNHSVTLSGTDNLVLRGESDNTFKYWLKQDYPNYPGNPYDAVFTYQKDGIALIGDYKNDKYVWIIPLRGSVAIYAPVLDNEVAPNEVKLSVKTDSQGTYEIAVINTSSHDLIPPQVNFDYSSAVSDNKSSLDKFCATFSDIDNFEAKYSIWANVESACGYFKTPTIVCSKAGMCAIWTWDNTFTGLALARRMPKEAMDTFMVAYDYLREDGYMPDSITDLKIDYFYTKPPVHGYMYRLYMQENEYFSRVEQVRRVVEPMILNTKWWLTARGVPCYTHGNDSGADNASCFMKYQVATTPELYSLLAVQCDVIADLLKILGDQREYEYRELSKKLAHEVKQFDYDNTLHIRSIETGEYVASSSLTTERTLMGVGIIDDDIVRGIIKRIPKFECEYGLVSEPLDSPYYVTNGYWRGAIWAPDQIMIITALIRAGERDYAMSLARKYHNALERAGMSENVDAVTYEGIRCPMYNWTSAAYIYLDDLLRDYDC